MFFSGDFTSTLMVTLLPLEHERINSGRARRKAFMNLVCLQSIVDFYLPNAKVTIMFNFQIAWRGKSRVNDKGERRKDKG